MSAPSINSEIRDSGIIEGGGQGFKPKEVEHLIKILQAGSLPASLNPTPAPGGEGRPDPGRGHDRQGLCAPSGCRCSSCRSSWSSTTGSPAWWRSSPWSLNMILLIGSMAFMQATFSLPGLAGLALTIGMAVDANVLVFERMREEKERGREPRPADPQRLQPGLGHDLRLARHQLAGRASCSTPWAPRKSRASP